MESEYKTNQGAVPAGEQTMISATKQNNNRLSLHGNLVLDSYDTLRSFLVIGLLKMRSCILYLISPGLPEGWTAQSRRLLYTRAILTRCSR